MVTRKERHRQRYANKKIVLITLLSFVCGITLWLYSAWSDAVLPVNVPGMPNQADAGQWLPRWKNVLFLGIPGIANTAEAQSAVRVTPEFTVQNVLHGTMLFFTSIDTKDLRSLLKAEIPLLTALQSNKTTVSAMSLPNFPKFDPVSISKEKPLVGIYHTHTAESYIPSSGVAHKPGGQRGDIVNVGEALVKRLQTHGVIALQDTTIHDYPSFMKAYGVSEGTVKKMLNENPSIQMIFDIHRDAGKREDTTVTVNGMQVAKITIMVATGQPDLPQPHWQQNHAFAKLLDAKLNEHFPGLSNGILLDGWRYNQHLHPRALLIEVGCQENSREEAERSIEMLGDVIAEIIAENK